MKLQDPTGITYTQAKDLDESTLRRWLTWAIKGDPAEARISKESMGNKGEILQALVWIGAISGF